MYRLRDQKNFIDSKMCDVLADSSTAEQYATCKLAALKQIKDRYAQANAGIKKAGPKLAFKNYYVTILSQVKTLGVNYGETVRAYDQRQGSAETRTDEAWTLFEVEMGF